MNRVLGLDYGSVRIGVAVSDELRMLARPVEFIPAKEPWERIQQLVAEFSVSEIVVGLPTNMDGSDGPASERARKLMATLRSHVDLPIIEEDERLSTVQAHKSLANAGWKAKDRRDRVDASAAAVILQDYLDRDGI